MTISIPVIRVVVTLPLVIALPGYALSAALFVTSALGTPERILSSIGLSLAITMIGGLFLNWTAWGMQTTSWTVWLGSITLGASAVALWRRRDVVSNAIPVKLGLSLRQGALVYLAASIVVLAIGMARTPTPQQGLQGYTTLWMLPNADGDQHAVHLGMDSMEFSSTQYILQLKVDGHTVQEWPSIELRPGERWEHTATLPLGEQTEAVLYLQDKPNSVYRRVMLDHDA